MDLLLTSHASN